MKFKCIFALIILTLIFGFTAQAQVLKGTDAAKKVEGASMIRLSGLTGNPDYIRLTPEAEVVLAKSEPWIRKVFHLADESSWNIISEEKGGPGEVHYRCQQTWKGIPVKDAIFILHTRNGNIYSVNGTLYSEIQPSNQAILDRSAALEKALTYVGATEYMWNKPQEEALLKQMTGKATATFLPEGTEILFFDKASKTFQYAWSFDIYAAKPLSRQDVYVNASTGKILLSINKIHTTDSPGTAVTKYSGTQNMTTDMTGPGAYRLRETGRGDGIQTYNMNKGVDYSLATDFTDTDNNWNNVNADQDEVAGDAHWGTEMTYDYFMLEHGRNSIDNNGFALISYVHFDLDYANAFWDGLRMTYGDGDGAGYTPFTALDITGHEITHGLTSFTANLEYTTQESGSLNEGFSDIFGTCVEFYAKPALANWTCGENIGTIIRSLSNPNSSGNPDTYMGTDWDPGQEMHQNSTVCSHWFYRLAMGGSGTNDIGNAFNVTAQGLDKAGDIAFVTLTEYLTSTSDFADARFYSIIAASEIYGGCSPEVESTTNAWYAVGVGAAYVNEVTPEFSADYTSVCSAPVSIQFQNQTTNANTYLWNFGDGTTSTLSNPQHTYAAAGDYNVTLTGFGGACGNDSLTKTSFISINTSNSAVAVLPSLGAGMTQTCCSGVLYDDGGTGDYSNNSESTITIAPTGAMSVALNFTSFDMESGYDYLYIYDGPSTASPLIGQYDGTSLPNGGTITSSGGAITIQQITDAGVIGGGYEINWLCNIPNAAPNTTFTANTTESCTGVIQFTDHSSNGPITWHWDFGDGTTSTLQNPTHAFTSSGIYNVKLRSSNSFGTDSLIRSNYITISLPAAPAVTPATTCDSNTATLTATGNGQLDWYNAATGGTLLGSGPSFTTPVLYTTTTYYVEDKILHTSVYGGKTDNSGSGDNFSSASNFHYEIFDCYTPLTLVSVKVYASGGGNRTIQLRDSAQTVLETISIYIPDGESRVTLNFDVPVKNKLQLVGSTDMNLFRNNNGSATYPYTIAGLLSVTESSASLPPYNVMGNYYYFYDWEVKERTCISARIPVVATVTQCSGIEEPSGLAGVSVSPNPTQGIIDIQYTAENSGTFDMHIIDIAGRTLAASTIGYQPGVNHFSYDLSGFAEGVYYVRLSGTDGSRVIKVIKSE